MSKPSSPPVAFSYTRFSTTEQSKGDSLRRQTAGAEAYCARHGLTLDASLSLRDLGVSAFKGAHRTSDKHALAQFLKLAREGRIPAGSFLIVENLDRLKLARDERTALRLWMDILDEKINIVQLHPETVFRHEKSDMFDIMRAIMELSRGHSESAIKSQRLGEVWDTKRAGIGERKLTGKAPFWLALDEEGTGFVLKPDRVEVVRRMFALARSGHGSKAIARRLNEDGIPSPQGKPWNNVSVLHTLRSRAVIGEFTPRSSRNGHRLAVAPPIPDYYPAILDEADYLAVQQATQERRQQRGPRGKGVRNLFTELLYDARDGTPMHIIEKQKGNARLVSSGAIRGEQGAKYASFSLAVFEEAALSLLREIDPREVLGTGGEADETQTLAAELARVESKIAELEDELLKGDVAAIGRTLRRLETQKAELVKRLSEARQRAASPLSETWGEAQTLLAALDAAPDREEARLRLRSILRRVVDSVRLLAVARGRFRRLAAVQFWFKDGERCRDFVILHEAAGPPTLGRDKADWWAQSFSGVGLDGDLDLRKPAHAVRLSRVLEKIDLDTVKEGGDEEQ